MRYFILFTALILLAINLVAGQIITEYDKLKIISSSSIILLNAIILNVIQHIKLKDAFRISLNILFPLLAIIEFCISLFVSATWTNNYAFIVILSMLAFQIVTIAAVKTKSGNADFQY